MIKSKIQAGLPAGELKYPSHHHDLHHFPILLFRNSPIFHSAPASNDLDPAAVTLQQRSRSSNGEARERARGGRGTLRLLDISPFKE